MNSRNRASVPVLTKFKHMNNLNNAVAVLLITAIGFLVIGGALLMNASDIYMTNFATLSLMISAFLTIVAIAVQPRNNK